MEEQAILAQVGLDLARLVASQTAGVVSRQIAKFKATKDANKLRESYEEIISELLEERAEAIRIAQTYKEKLDRIEISDEDIRHLHQTIENLIEVIGGNIPEESKSNLDPILKLIDINTLKTMQLLGFNYKRAIGEPLTSICAEAITSILKSPSSNGGSHGKAARNRQK